MRGLVSMAVLGVALAGANGWAGDACAPGKAPIIRSWQTEAGLPQNTVNSIVQTRDGYLWVATPDGLARFDGVRFTVFGLEEGLSTVDISALYQDHAGTLWIGTVGGGLNRWVDGRFEVVSQISEDLASDMVTSFAEDRRGRLWIGGSGGLRLWEAGRPVQEAGLREVAHYFVRALLCDHQQRMWIATRHEGLFCYDGKRLALRPGPPENPVVSAYCLLEDHQGRLWAGVGNGMVLCLETNAWRVYNQTNGLPFAYVTSLAEDAQGTVWAGSLDAGLYRFEQDRFEALRIEQGLSANDIRCLQNDREGNLWVGTRTGGLNRLSRRRLLHFGVAQGLTNDFTRGLAESADGALWVATAGGGMYRGGLQGFEPFAPNEIARFYAHPESVLVTSNGDLWCGGSGALLCWKGETLKFCFTNESWVRGSPVTALCDDGQGGVWIGNASGTVAHEQNGRVGVFPGRAARGGVTAFAREPDGSLWVGSRSGDLRRIHWGDDRVLAIPHGPFSRAILALCLDHDDTLWIGTAGGGLARRRGGQFATFAAKQGLGANTVAQIVEDDFGCLWLGCNRGIICVRKSELEDLAAGRTGFLHPRVYGVNDGMETEECSSGFSPAGVKTRSGLICFSTVKGLVMVDPRQTENNSPPPEVLLEEALINGKPARYRNYAKAAGPSAAPSMAPLLIVSPGGRDLEIHYTGIDFSSPEKLSFRYRLDGLENDWIEVGGRRTAYYHRLPPGQFRFRVAVCSANGQWNERPAALAIQVQPFFWETPWFRTGAGLGLAGILAGTFRAVERRKYRRRLKALETQDAIKRERLRISQDMHDHVGAILTQVSQLSDLGQSEENDATAARRHFERIGAQARNAVQAMDEIVWATNPKNDNLPRFAEYVCRFADEFFEASPVRCWQEVPTDLPRLALAADVRHNVFLAVREAFHNVAKHSGASEVWLRLSCHDSEAHLEIEDNGQGFDPLAVNGHGNGLENIRVRLAGCHGGAEFDSAPGKNTRIHFRFPVEPPA